MILFSEYKDVISLIDCLFWCSGSILMLHFSFSTFCLVHLLLAVKSHVIDLLLSILIVILYRYVC